MVKSIWGTSKRITLVISLIFMLVILGVNLVNAESIGTYAQNAEMQITNYCSTADCTYANLTRIKLPNGTIETINEEMTQTGYDFNYSYTPTLIGTYYFTTCSNPTGENVCEEDSFDVTSYGRSGNENIVFFIFIILLIYGITFIGFFGRNIPMTILGGMALIFLGIYLINHGIIIFRDDLTNYVSYLTIGIGAITSFWAILEQLEII